MMLSILEYCAIAVAALSGVLAARGKGVDLVGVVVLAVVTALGGGTLRDLCLGATPVFWVTQPAYVVIAACTGLLKFALPGRIHLSPRVFEIADAVCLALFTTVGTTKSLNHDAPAIIAVAFGVVTGVAGGVVRDVLLNDVPLLLRKEIKLYATAATIGATVFVLCRRADPAANWPALVGSATTLLIRLVAIRWELAWPEYRDSNDPAGAHRSPPDDSAR
jgi:uncharacterized membrane protein YeiH